MSYFRTGIRCFGLAPVVILYLYLPMTCARVYHSTPLHTFVLLQQLYRIPVTDLPKRLGFSY